MGPQSQQRLTLQQRKHQMQSNSNRKKKRGQQTLFGDKAFDPLEDCEVCRAKQYGRIVHRGHHKLCTNNRRKPAQQVSLAREEKRLKTLFAAPLAESEKCSGRYITAEAGRAFFAPRLVDDPGKTTTTITNTAAVMETSTTTSPVKTVDLYTEVATIIKDAAFLEGHKSCRAPLAMVAFAKVVVEKIIRNAQVDIGNYFKGMTITVPDVPQLMIPSYHAIVGQKLIYMDWQRMHGITSIAQRAKTTICSMEEATSPKTRYYFRSL